MQGCIAVEGWWLPDPTRRCELRFRRADGTYTDHVVNRGTVLIDPWEIATANRRPVEPWTPGTRYCWRCNLGAVDGEAGCSRCGGALATKPTDAQVALANRSSRRRVLITAAVCLLVVGGFGLAVALGESPRSGEASAAGACSTFRQGVLSAAGGTSTVAEADEAIHRAREQATAAATLNGEFRQLLVMMTMVANGTGDGLAVLDECRRLGL